MASIAHNTFILSRVDAARTTFVDRTDAGQQLARVVAPAPDSHALVLALPRGGVPVAAPVADALGCDLRAVAVRKLPIPSAPEMGFGAITLDGTVVLNHDVMQAYGVTIEEATQIASDVRMEVERRADVYPGSSELPGVRGRRVFIIDDGLATGYTMIAACQMVRRHDPASLIVAVPVAPTSAVDTVSRSCDELICLLAQDRRGFAVASFYRHFPDLSDREVREALIRRDPVRGGARR